MELRIRVEETSLLHFEGALLTKKLAELVKNLKMNMTKPEHIYIRVERLFSLNVLL